MKYIKIFCVFCMMFLPVMVFAQGQIKRSSTTRTPPPSSNTVRRSSSTSAAKEKNVNKKQSVSVKSGTIDGHDYVDLGLPSGTLWATCNVGASKPEDYGNYYAWGETVTKTVYDWSTYKWTEGASETPIKYTGSSSAELELSDDAAYVNWGKNWRMPSEGQLEELFNDDYTTTTWTSINGIYGRKITSKMPGYTGNSIFLPAAGYYNRSSLRYAGSNGYYWSRTLNVFDTSFARDLGFYSSNLCTYIDRRYFGQSIRPVRNKVEVSHSEVRDSLVVTEVVPSLKTEVLQAPVSSDKSGTIDGHDYVDLGLPSGTLWATCNVGASKPEGYGNYYAWGETATKTVYIWSTYKWANGSSSSLTKYTGSSSAELQLSDDAAYVNWGKNWRMPSQAQFEELINSNYTTTTWTSINGIYGRKITSKMPGYTGNSIFLPAAGYCNGSSLYYAGSGGYYWSRTLNVSSTSNAMYLFFDSSNILTNSDGDGRCYGQSVRPVRFSE